MPPACQQHHDRLIYLTWVPTMSLEAISGHATIQTGLPARVKSTSAVSSSLSQTSLTFCELNIPRSLFCSVFLQYLAQQCSDSYAVFPGMVPKQTRSCNSAVSGLTDGFKSPAANPLKWSGVWLGFHWHRSTFCMISRSRSRAQEVQIL